MPKPETVDNRTRIPAGMPQEMMGPAAPLPLRSGRWSPCAFSANADTVRIRVSTPMMIVNAARFFRFDAIRYFLFTEVNGSFMAYFYFKSPIPTTIAAFCRKTQISGEDIVHSSFW
jgi:hypothetical protein